MLEFTNEEKDNFTKKLNEIGLDLENIPNFLKDFKPLDFRPLKKFDNKEYLVYRYVPVSKIQILITPTNRLTDIKEKYSLAKPISEYLKQVTEENIENFATFLNMLKNTNLESIKEIETKQENFRKSIPYRVRYEKNYLWQIYYSEYSNQYFMLVPSEEGEYETLFYLLKEQIKQNNENNPEEYIYVPIVNFEPSENILKRDERRDIENYLWLFTKQWPNFYEVQDFNGLSKIIIIGEVEVYSSIYATYRVMLKNREEGLQFYKQIKALFILQTELPDYYKFRAQIDEDGELQLFYNESVIKYKELSNFIKLECIKTIENIENTKKEKRILSAKLEELKQVAKKREAEFQEKQKEITLYLQYKKTFFGRVKYFFTKKKTKENIQTLVEEVKVSVEDDVFSFEEKVFYTIEDLISICNVYTNISKQVKNFKLDIDALRQKIENLEKKIKNAKQYINEIDSHKKSIFDFWKFSTKDEKLALNEPEQIEQITQKKSLRKIFDYENDREEITKQIDEKQRKILSKEEEDSIFVAKTQILPILNKLKSLIKIPDNKIQEILDELKNEAMQEEKLYGNEEHDVFGNTYEDKTKIRVLGNSKHRENGRDKFQILGITSEINLTEFKDILKKIEINLSKAIEKTKNVIDMPIYKLTSSDEKIDLYNYNIYSINPEKELEKSDKQIQEFNLYKLNLKEDMPAVFYTNIIYFDNYNRTLPLGMDKSNELIINSNDYSFTLLNKKTVYTNQYFQENIDDAKWNVKKVYIYEYDIELKRKMEVNSD